MRFKKINKGLVLILAIIMVTGTFTGCSKPEEKPSDTGKVEKSNSSEVSKGGSVATFVIDEDPKNINYHASLGGLTDCLIIMATHDWLSLYDTQTGEYEPMLLESWEHNENYTEWVMHIRKGVKWHDGVEFTADDIKFTYEYMQDPNTDIMDRDSYGKPDETIEVVDDYTYKIITDKPNPTVISRWTMPVPKHIWENVDPANFSKAEEGYLTVGLGPYKMVEYKVGEYIKFEAFDDYYGGKPKIDTIYYRIIRDKTAQIAALESGQVDCLTVNATAAEQILENQDIMSWEGSSGNVAHLYMNNKREAFKDINVRKAIAHLVNREILVEQAMRGFAEPAYTCFAPNDFYYNPDITTKYDFSVEKAVELLEKAGYSKNSDGIMEKDGEKLEFEVIPGFPEAETAILIMAQDFIKAGIKIQPKNVDQNVLNTVWETHDYDMMISGMTMGPDPIRYRCIYDYKDSVNIMQYENDEMSQLFSDVASTLDENEKKELYEKIQKKKSEDVPSVELWYRDTIYAYNKNLVINEAGPIGMAHFRFLHMENLYFNE